VLAHEVGIGAPLVHDRARTLKLSSPVEAWGISEQHEFDDHDAPGPWLHSE
jgi:hypothetical protein